MENNDSKPRTTETDSEVNDNLLGDHNRRTILKTLAAAGLFGTGVAGASGTAAAQGGGTELEEIEIEDAEVYAEQAGTESPKIPDSVEAGDLLGTFSGVLEIEKSAVAEPVSLATPEDADAAIEVTEGKLEGEFTPTVDGVPGGAVEEEWNGSPLLQIILDLLDPNGGECPILFLELGPLFLDLLGLEVSLSQITLDITAVTGEGNLLGNLLCAVAGLLDP